MTEENNEDMICPCKGTKGCNGHGWKWCSSDLGNRHYVGSTSYKAGQTWVEICVGWIGDELPPDPPGITNIQRYRIDAEVEGNALKDASGKAMRFHNKRRGK
jgi:hypothetical protein